MSGDAQVIPVTDEVDLGEAVAAGSMVYLSFGPAPAGELARVIGQHLEVDRAAVDVQVRRLIRAGVLHEYGNQVSLPAGSQMRQRGTA